MAGSIEDELSVFSEEVEDRRRDPIDPSYLDEGGADTTTDKPPRSQSQPETQQAVAPKPAASKPAAKPRNNGSPTPIAAPATLFWVQLSASGDVGKAQKMKRKVSGMGFKSVIVKEGGYHKVRVGPYAARASASRDMKKLNGKLGTKGWIVAK